MRIQKKAHSLRKNKFGKIIFEDKDFFILDKFSGINSTDISPLICHRLDRDTSGLIIVAKNKKTKEVIQEQFRKKKISKKYLALVLGKVEPKFKVEGFIFRDRKAKEKRKFIPSFEILDFEISGKKHQKYSETKFKRLKVYQQNIFPKPDQRDLNYFSLIQAMPITGRTHQIRLHLQSCHQPILGDDLYSGKIMKKVNEKLKIPRLLLHAYVLKMRHPITNKLVNFKSEIPTDFNQILGKLKRKKC